MEIPFAKLEAAGNGYIALDGRDLDCDWSLLARRMTDPHFGVGSDGLVVVARSSVAPVRMRIFNSDGSESEMSGNGIRLFAKFVIDRGIVTAGEDGLRIETGGGVRTVFPRLERGRVVAARVAMGAPRFEPEAIPARPEALGAPASATRLWSVPLSLGGQRLAVTCLSIGNPHAVAILDRPVDDFPLADVGPLVQSHPAFPNRVNFEIVNLLRRDALRVRVYERGEGETLSSGTGSTAAAIAARVHERCDDEVEVSLRGGRLRITWTGSGEAMLEGPAREVFRGVWREG